MDFTGKRIGAPTPGIVISHAPARSQRYIGSPSLLNLGAGSYLATHDEFGPGSTEHTLGRTHVFFSQDHGRTWHPRATIDGAFWSLVFSHREATYLLGTDRHHGNLVIRRSNDAGETWTQPTGASTGLIRADGEYHCAPLPLIEHAGRLWRAFERRVPPEGWAPQYCAGVISAAVGADLLDASSWTVSNFLPSQRSWNGGDMGGWLEGNIVRAPSGELIDLLRVDVESPDEVAASVSIAPDGRTVTFDAATGFHPFPGGAKMFAVRYDTISQRYWTIAGPVAPVDRGPPPAWVRNNLVLQSSADLRNWTESHQLLYHPDTKKHGFQYVSWEFDGPDITFLCRTAFDDDEDGAHTKHDANFLTFHRIANFRDPSPTRVTP